MINWIVVSYCLFFLYFIGISFFFGFILGDELRQKSTSYMSVLFAFVWPYFVIPLMVRHFFVERNLYRHRDES